jgi:two-component system LytT family response regulator
VNLGNISLITSAGSYADVHLCSGEKFQASRSLKYLAAQMETLGFFRCHDSFVVNLNEVEQYSKGRGGTLRMRSGEEVPVSRYRREPLMELLHPSVPSSSSASTPTDN